MSLPALAHTHQFRVNQTIAGNATLLTQNQNLIFAIDQALLGIAAFVDADNVALGSAPTGKLTLVGNSNSVSSNMTGTDLCTAASNFVWATTGNARTWRVYQCNGYQLLMDLRQVSSTADSLDVRVSVVGFGTAHGGTNGSTTAAPTATDQVDVRTAAAWGGSSAANTATVMHVSISTNGKSIRVGLDRTSHPVAHWFWAWAGNALAGWTSPYWFYMVGSSAAAPSTDVIDFTTFCSSTQLGIKGIANASTSITITAPTLAHAGADTTIVELFASPGSISAGYAFASIHLISRTVGTVEPNLGIMSDTWYHQTSLVHGFGYPGDEVSAGLRNQFMNAGPFVVPWNKTTRVIA